MLVVFVRYNLRNFVHASMTTRICFLALHYYQLDRKQNIHQIHVMICDIRSQHVLSNSNLNSVHRLYASQPSHDYHHGSTRFLQNLSKAGIFFVALNFRLRSKLQIWNSFDDKFNEFVFCCNGAAKRQLVTIRKKHYF